MASWGDTSFALNANGSRTIPWPRGPDARDGNQPIGTKILNNVSTSYRLLGRSFVEPVSVFVLKFVLKLTERHCPLQIVTDIGIWQKQSSMWFQATSAQSIVKGNVHFNGPRAGINVNDGMGGGDEITENLLANCVRESGDHGPFVSANATH